MLQAPGDGSRWFVLEKGWRRARFNTHEPDHASTFISLDSQCELGRRFARHGVPPRLCDERQVFLSWTEGTPMVSTIARFTMQRRRSCTLAGGSRQNVIRVNQPFENHNGGQIDFGPDGYLYTGFGDGGAGGDPRQSAQDTTDLLGDSCGSM